MNNKLHELAQKVGVAERFTAVGKEFEVEEKIVRFFCTHLGFPAQTEEQIEHSLKKADHLKWEKTLDEILILTSKKMFFEAVFENKDADKEISIKIISQQNKDSLGLRAEQKITETREERGKTLVRVRFDLKELPPLGYYDLELKCGSKTSHSVMAVTPDQCYVSTSLENEKLWGFSLQLYALKSKRNWGVGDFTDLKNFVSLAANAGADVIGLNPLNVLFHDFPENASPYSSISRLFLNPVYIDVENVPGFKNAIYEENSAEIEALRNTEIIDYTGVYNLKMKVLKHIFDNASFPKQYQKEFEKFKKQKGSDLELLALYQALYSDQKDKVWGGWMGWPKELQTPNSLSVQKFKTEHMQEIEFFKFIQFEADRQLRQVYETVTRQGLKIGLYRDLPVGVCKDSAELWQDKSIFIDSAGAGAPPDVFFSSGQKWCLGAFDPFELKKRAYKPFLKVLRANMAYAGALRIDHVMSLMRLFMIPDCMENGTYISYAFDDMLALLALESHLHQCCIVGESIGNVPAGFLEALEKHKIYAISVLWSERWPNGLFKMPRDYPQKAFVSVGTHDMAPLKMWWFGGEIDIKHRLKMVNDEEMKEIYKGREKDRRILLDALDYDAVWPKDHLRLGDYLYGEGYPEGIEEAVHTLLAQSESQVVMLEPENIFGVNKLQNLPGTDRDKYPNWRQKIPVNLEEFAEHEAFKRNTSLMRLRKS